ncbi:RodZ domain-containing protein [Qipengyuania sp. JC766]|uniref:helix-turn-helix domain-containing protein n=1 Tax=Qipengyuania sp. JC766 TaxID=3232139 RepID=UPI00345A9671
MAEDSGRNELHRRNADDMGPDDTMHSDSVREDNPGYEIPAGAGPQLRAAREARGLSMDDVAEQTRIPLRHIETIERGAFDELPARTYAIGFSRNYAKVVGLDQQDIAAMVRAELDESGAPPSQSDRRNFEPGDPNRVPSRGLAIFSAFAAILLVVGVIAYFGDMFFPGSGPGPVTEETTSAQAANEPTAGDAPAPTPTGGPVIFTALEDEIWVRFYDGTEDNILLEKIMSEGESYTVPADAQDPQINTGRPDALGISIGGEVVPKLSEELQTINEVKVSADALLARGDTPEPAETPEG